MGLFSRKKNSDGPAKASKKKGAAQQTHVDVAPPKPRWEDAWTRTTVEPEEVQELISGCTVELKSRGTVASYTSRSFMQETILVILLGTTD
jgi:hypothetical protein